MAKLNRKILLIVVSIGIVMVSVGVFYVAQELMTESAHVPQWVNIEYWGRMNETTWRTPVFEITGEKWRVWWNTNPVGGLERCNISVYHAINDTLVSTTAITKNGKEYGAILYCKGFFYMRLQISSEFMDFLWWMYVDDFR
jgi:hypothetical protein